VAVRDHPLVTRVRWAIGGAAVVAIAVGILAVVAWNGGGDATSPAADTHAGLCEAMEVARNDDVEAARAAFYDRSHDGLHELAADANEVDPAAAAGLLEAKFRVEAMLDESPDPAELTAALDTLADATAGAAEVVGEGDVNGCG
jgi:hypothetical protein